MTATHTPSLLERYGKVAGERAVQVLRQLGRHLNGAKLVHINSTKEGGGVAEILHKMVPLMQELGINTEWHVIDGNPAFFQCTKGFHNALQGNVVPIPDALLREYHAVNTANAERLRPVLEDADFVIIHDPQPAALLRNMPGRKGKWIWRCHIDLSRPYRPVWKFVRDQVRGYDASVFSLPQFAQPLPHPQFLVAPSIDPLSDKNMDLPPEEIEAVRERFGLDPGIPVILQVSRFDRFKDPLGVIAATRIAQKHVPLTLVLAGGGAHDDPEGEAVLREVREAVDNDPSIRVALLPSDAHRDINALQRIADVIIQKSLKEGFGLTVTEAMWKHKPVIGGDVGGIRLQVVNHHTGFLVRTPEGAALRIRYLLRHRDRLEQMGREAREFVRDHYLLPRHVQDYLTIMLRLKHGQGHRLEL